MQIILNQSEISEAIKEIVLQQIAIREDQKVNVSFDTTESDEIIAVITIAKADSEVPSGGGNENKPPREVRTRTKRINPPASSSTGSTGTGTETSPQTEIVQTTIMPQADSEKPPADNDHVADGATQFPDVDVMSEPAPTDSFKSGGRIFPDAATSAPASQEPPPVVGAAKSLFANLTKPVHDAPRD